MTQTAESAPSETALTDGARQPKSVSSRQLTQPFIVMKTMNLDQLEVQEMNNQEMIDAQGGSFLNLANVTEIFDFALIGTSLSIGGND